MRGLGDPSVFGTERPRATCTALLPPLGAENCRVARTHWKPRPGQQTGARPRSLPVTPPNSSQSPQPREPRGTRRLCLSGLRWPGTRVAAHPPPPVGLLAGVGFEPPHGVPSPLPRASRRRGVGSWRCGESRGPAGCSVGSSAVSLRRSGRRGGASGGFNPRLPGGNGAESPTSPEARGRPSRGAPHTCCPPSCSLCCSWLAPRWRPGWRPAVSSPGWPLCPPPLPCGRSVSAWSPDLSAGRAVLSLGFCCFFVHI